jgi:hypothetical protein
MYIELSKKMKDILLASFNSFEEFSASPSMFKVDGVDDHCRSRAVEDFRLNAFPVPAELSTDIVHTSAADSVSTDQAASVDN